MADSLQKINDSTPSSVLNYHKFLFAQDSLELGQSDTLSYTTLDEIFKATEKEQIERESIFTGHYLQKKSKSELDFAEKNEKSDPWIFGVLVVVAILFCWIFSSYRVRISQMFRACFSNRYMSILMKDGNILKEIIILPIAITYIPLLSLLLYKLADIYFIETVQDLSGFASFIVYIIILAAVTVFTFIKFFAIKFLGNVFRSAYISSIYIVNDVVFDLFIAIILFPLLFVVFFSHDNLYEYPMMIALVITGIAYIIKIIRGFSLTLISSKFSKLYLFYYLCSVEIIPILIIGKLLISIGFE